MLCLCRENSVQNIRNAPQNGLIVTMYLVQRLPFARVSSSAATVQTHLTVILLMPSDIEHV